VGVSTEYTVNNYPVRLILPEWRLSELAAAGMVRTVASVAFAALSRKSAVVTVVEAMNMRRRGHKPLGYAVFLCHGLKMGAQALTHLAKGSCHLRDV